MGRPKKSAAAPVEPEFESQEVPEDEPETDEEPVTADGKPISKAEAIRQALARGIDSPEDATDFIRKTYGLEVSRQHFSASRSTEEKKSAAGAPAAPAKRGRPPGKAQGITVTVKRGRKPKAASESHATPAPARAEASATPVAGSSGSVVGDLAAVKALVKKLGAEQVRQIVDLFE